MFVSLYFVMLIGVVIPVACVRSYFKLKAGAPFPPKVKLHQQTLLMHAFFLSIALFTAKTVQIPIFLPLAPRTKDLAMGAGLLALLVGVMYPLWKARAARQPEKVYRRMPSSNRELWLWAAVSLSAGFVEEIVYRGALFQILYYWIGNWWIAAVTVALSFALGHAIQGWRNVLIIFAMAMAFQGLVWATGTLYVAMAVHAIYDFVAGLAYASFYRGSAPEPAAATETA